MLQALNHRTREIISAVVEAASRKSTESKMINPERFSMITDIRDFLVARDANVKLEDKPIEYFTTMYHEQIHKMVRDEFLSGGE